MRCSRKGAFIGCSGYPDCGYSRPLDAELGGDGSGAASELFAAGADVTALKNMICIFFVRPMHPS